MKQFNEIVPGIFTSGNVMQVRQDFALSDIPGTGSGSPNLEVNQAADQEGQENPNIRETDEYLIRLFRVLSAITIYGKGYPIDYSKKDVLSNAAHLFERTLLKNHWRSIEEWVGLVKKPVFNSASNPPGVDAEFWLDKVIDKEHIVRGVKTGAINRCSAGLMFEWSKSHPDMKDRTFFDSLGEDIDGHEVRIVVEKILEVFEVSLVFYGADHTAIAHTAGDEKANTALSQQIEKEKNTQEVITMKEKLIALIRMVKDSSITSRSLSTDVDVESGVKALVEAFNALADEKATVDQEVARLKPFEAFHSDQVAALRQECNRLLGVVNLGKEVPAIQKDMVDNADFAALEKYRKDFQDQADEKFPMKCPKCNTKMERRSSVEQKPPDPEPQRKQTGYGEINYM